MARTVRKSKLSFGITKVDKSIKVELVKDRLESEGYDTDLFDNKLYAWMRGESAEDVRSRMERIFS